MIHLLLDSPMSLQALGNRTGEVDRGNGKLSGGITALHAVASQASSKVFYALADKLSTYMVEIPSLNC